MSKKAPDRLAELIDAAVLDQPKARRLLRKWPELLHARRGLGETALHFLTVEDFVPGVRFLAEMGADVDAKNESGDSPLINATILGYEEMVGTLLSFGADPNTKSPIWVNALHCATSRGNLPVVTALLQAGADPCYCIGFDTIFTALSKSGTKREELLACLKTHGIELKQR